MHEMRCYGAWGASTPAFLGLGRVLVHALYVVLLQHTRTIPGLPRSDPVLMRSGWLKMMHAGPEARQIHGFFW